MHYIDKSGDSEKTGGARHSRIPAITAPHGALSGWLPVDRDGNGWLGWHGGGEIAAVPNFVNDNRYYLQLQ